MCYYPYFRGKQYELITIRECAEIFSQKNFVPIIEPVKGELEPLKKALRAIGDSGSKAIVICNPQFGDHRTNASKICDLLDNDCKDSAHVINGVLLTEKHSVDDALTLINRSDKELALIHAGFSQAKELSARIQEKDNISTSIFLEDFGGKLYQKHFANHSSRVLMRDGFQRRRNRDHPEVEFFSDLHVTYPFEKMTGFGDYLMVGDDYSETGGPAFAIAIHITFIDNDKDDEMHIHHFVSKRQDTPEDPAGKFAEALEKLMAELKGPTKIQETSAIQEFRDLHERAHFPGLGYVKKLSMKHHIETLAGYF